MQPAFELLPDVFELADVKRRVKIQDVDFDEDFLSVLISNYFKVAEYKNRPTISTAFEIYMREHPSAQRRRFINTVNNYYNTFYEIFGDVPLEGLRHWHITNYRDKLLAKGLNPNSVRKHNNILNAMINMAFKHLDIDRLSPFRGLRIKGEGELVRPIPPITLEKLTRVKEFLVNHKTPARLIGLIQLNTGCRISEPALARLEDLVLEHDIPHLWIRKNEHTDRKTKSSIRAIPLCGISLEAAQDLYKLAKRKRSEWLVPEYAKEIGGATCSATLNKALKPFEFRSHFFRHAFIDRIKARSDIPIHIAESITGHGRTQTEFSAYGSIGYTLEQKKDIIEKIIV